MCGICGVVQVGGEPRGVVAPDVLDRMTDAMTHRGPNDRGTFLAPGIALGVRRLSIVDVAGGHQPFANEDKSVWAVQNGELYNHDEIRNELRGQGHRFASRCDTEILPHLYEDAGVRFAERLRGKFGIAVWDDRRRRAVIARDRLGVKPMYYAHVGDLVIFASELKSVLASGLVGGELDFEAIEAYMTLGFVPGPLTPLAAVRKVMPGERLIVDTDGVRLERYWSYPKPDPDLTSTPQELAEGLMGQLEDAVRTRLMSDVPLGAMLSGGLDSSLIVALMARHMTEPVKTFSIGFAEDGETSELADARYVSSVYGTEHHELEISYTQQEISLDDLVWSLDEPVADLSSLGFMAISQLAAKHVTVALSGQGADELLGGYKKHRAAALVERWRRLPGPLRAVGERTLLHGPARIQRSARTLAAGDPVDRLLAMSGRVDDSLRRELYRGELAETDGRAAMRAIAPLAAGIADEPLAATLHIDGQLALVDDMLHYFDRTSMLQSLEVRVPFLDHHVVEYCARIPTSLKVNGRGLRTKHLLKEAARGIVPQRIIDKRKLGFLRGATGGWLEAQMQGAISDYLLGPSPRYAEFIDQSAVERLVARQRTGQGDSNLLVSILMLEVWLDSYLPRAIGRPVSTTETIRLAR
jgi:asparagine synthase (glutamine-hydrolysing)